MDTPYELGECPKRELGQPHIFEPAGPDGPMQCKFCFAAPIELHSASPRKHALGGLSFHDYETAVSIHRQYPLAGQNVIYPVMGLCADSARLLAEIQAKWRANQENQLTLGIDDADVIGPSSYSEVQRRSIAMKMGAVLWNLNCLAQEFGYSLTDIAAFNIVHLQGRGTP